MRTVYPVRSNLDCTGRQIVRKGRIVQFASGATARVAVVRLGYFVPDVLPQGKRHFSATPCNDVRVVVDWGE